MLVYILKQVHIKYFSRRLQLAAVLLWSSANVWWTKTQHWQWDETIMTQFSVFLSQNQLTSEYADSYVQFGFISYSNGMKCTICLMLVGSRGSPDARCSRQYLITEHSKNQHDQGGENQGTCKKHFHPSERSPDLNNFRFPDLSWFFPYPETQSSRTTKLWWDGH